MPRKRYWLLTALILVPIAFYGVLGGGSPVPDHAFFAGSRRSVVTVIAHRGGQGLRPENTLEAFRHAASLGVDVLEMDLRRTADGALVVMHDSELERTTNGHGRIEDLTLDAIRELDAGFHWTPDDGLTFPYRGKGIQVPLFVEVVEAFPDLPFNVEMKPSAIRFTGELCRLIRQHRIQERVLVASFDQQAMNEFRQQCDEVATSATAGEIRRFLTWRTFFLGTLYRSPAEAFQVPERVGSRQVVTSSFVSTAHAHNIRVEVWTVNEMRDMERLLALGVDGIFTDYPDRLLSLVRR